MCIRDSLQAITVSDITNATGDALTPGIHHGQTSAWSSQTKWHHTNQPPPTRSAWRLWEKALDLFSTDLTLHCPLQQWLLPPSALRQHWTAYYHPLTATLLLRQHDIYEKHHRCCGTFDFDCSGFAIDLPETSYPVDVVETLSGWKIRRLSSLYLLGPTQPPSSFEAFCRLLPDLSLIHI